MDQKNSADWNEKLWAISGQSSDHRTVACAVRHRTRTAMIEQRALAIVAVVSAAIFSLLQEDNPYFLSTAAGTVGIFTGSGCIVKIVGSFASRLGVERLQRQHPARLKYILHEIRSKIVDLAPVVGQVERELFGSSPS